MITSINEFKLLFEKKKDDKEEKKPKKKKPSTAKIKENRGYDLVICDVQDVFSKYFPDDYLEKLNEYCETFGRVYQVWDTTKTDKASYNFPNQCGKYKKKYGGKLTLDNMVNFFYDIELETIAKKLQVIPNVGDRFDTIYGDCWIYVGQYAESNNKKGHDWFLCPKPLMDLCKMFKSQERQIVLVGGAEGECITDLFVTFKSFGLNVMYNPNYLYKG